MLAEFDNVQFSPTPLADADYVRNVRSLYCILTSGTMHGSASPCFSEFYGV
jgi:hypothetical protein